MDKTISIQPIGVSGVATSGKDTFYVLLKEHLKLYNIEVQRFALADKLKEQINDSLMLMYNISAFTSNPKEKKIIRPEMVKYGLKKRRQSWGTYWTKLLTNEIFEALDNNILPVITDVRYDEFPEDEVFWLKKILGGSLVHIRRFDENEKIVLPPNDHEKKNDPWLQAKADYNIVWRTEKEIDKLSRYIERFVNSCLVLKN